MDDVTRDGTGPDDASGPLPTSPEPTGATALDVAGEQRVVDGGDPSVPGAPVDVTDQAADDTDPTADDTEHADDGAVPPEDPAVLAAEQAQLRSAQNWVGWVIALGAAVLVFASLNPRLVLTDSTATGGDMGAHVWGPRFLMDHLLPSMRVTGWTPDWYAGFPAYVYYMVVPSLLVVWLAFGSGMWDGGVAGIVVGLVLRAAVIAGVVLGARLLVRRVGDRWFRPLIWVGAVFVAVLALPIPYNIAFKLVTVSGLVTLPIAMYVLGRAARVPFPGPPVMALASLFFIYDKGFTILGGNGASTMAGEFAFSISLTLSLLYLAVVFRGIRTGRDRALGAVLFGLTILCHLIPAIFAVIVTAVLLFVRREDRTPWWDATRAGRIVAGLLVLATLLILVPQGWFDTAGDGVPVVGGLVNAVGGPIGSLVDTVFPQWLFPAVGSLLALAFFSGFQPSPASWIRDGSRRTQYLGAVLVVTGVAVSAAALLGASRWTWVLLAVAAAIAVFAGVDARLFRWGIVVGPVGFLLCLFWFLPFYGNSTFMNDMGWERYTLYTDYLLSDPSLDSGGMQYRNLVFALAGLGVLLALIHRVRLGYLLVLTVVAFAWIFRYFPQYRLWNARLLPFYYLAIYLLAGLALALVVRSVAIAVQEWWGKRTEPAWVGALGAGVLGVGVLVVMMGAFSWLPNGTPGVDPNNPSRAVYRWGPFGFETTIVHNWAQWNYAGLEGKDAYPEFSGIMSMMEGVAEEHGCGRAMWEYESELQRYGTPMALMLLPYFTDGCVGSMEGLYFESSSTTPFHFLNQSELSAAPSRAQRDLPYSNLNVEQGVSHLQMMGVKYYMATSDAAIQAADADDRLTQVADETFTYVDSLTNQPVQQRWVVYEVADAELVTPLQNEPVVLSDADDHIDGWVYAKEEVEAVEGQPRPPKNPGPAVLWYNDPTRWDVLLATSGPDGWQRAPSTSAEFPATAVPEVTVSDVQVDTDSISFRVDEVGVPVLVRTSYFPNWTASGAEGPYRVTPNFMVVVPTDTQVTLSYGRSSIEWLGLLATLVGLALVGWLMVLDHRRGRLALTLDAPLTTTGTGADPEPEPEPGEGHAVDAEPGAGASPDEDPEPAQPVATAASDGEDPPPPAS